MQIIAHPNQRNAIENLQIWNCLARIRNQASTVLRVLAFVDRLYCRNWNSLEAKILL